MRYTQIKDTNNTSLIPRIPNQVTINENFFLTIDPGLVITPTWPASIVTGLRIYSSNNYKDRDPASYVFEGRKSKTDTWTLISQGDINLSRFRNMNGKFL